MLKLFDSVVIGELIRVYGKRQVSVFHGVFALNFLSCSSLAGQGSPHIHIHVNGNKTTIRTVISIYKIHRYRGSIIHKVVSDTKTLYPYYGYRDQGREKYRSQANSSRLHLHPCKQYGPRTVGNTKQVLVNNALHIPIIFHAESVIKYKTPLPIPQLS